MVITPDEIINEPRRFADGLDVIAMRLGRMVVSRYLDILLKLEPRLEEMETEIVHGGRNNTNILMLLKSIAKIKCTLL